MNASAKTAAEPKNDTHAPPPPEATPPAPAKSKNYELLELIATQDVGMQQDYTRQLVEIEIERARFDQQARLAMAFAQSGMFAEIKGKSEREALACAQAKIEMGRSWGMSPGDAMQFVFFVNGRPAIMNEYYAGAIIRAGYWWDISWITNAQTKEVLGCTLFLKVKDPSSPAGWRRVKDADGRDACATFTSEDAKKAKLHEKDTYKAWGQDMYFWRAMARLRKFYCPNILGGSLMAAEAADLDPIIEETQRQAAENKPAFVPPTRKEPAPERITSEQAAQANDAVSDWKPERVKALLKEFGAEKFEDLSPQAFELFIAETKKGDASE